MKPPPLPVPKDDGVIDLDHDHLERYTHDMLHIPSATTTEKGMANVMLAMLTERVRLYERLAELHERLSELFPEDPPESES